MATDFYSHYHKWYGDRPANWPFLEAKQQYWHNPLDLAALVREPSVSDSDWLKKISDRLMRSVRALHPYRVDAMELYDYGENVEIVRSLSPKTIMLTTSFNSGPQEAHRVWRELLRGTRGLILWDEKNEFVGKDGSLGERGRDAASYFGEIRRGLGALLINSRRHVDPIGILYSPASMRLQWLLDRRAIGEDWSRRDASAEYQDDAIRVTTRDFAHAFEHMGLQHRFVSSEEVRGGELHNGDYRVLILPHTIAMAPSEAEEIREFIEHGGVVVADGEPGIFDEHGRRAANPLLSEIFVGPATRSATSFVFGKGKAIYLALSNGRHRESNRRLAGILDAAGVRPPFPLIRADGRPVNDVETHVFDNREATIVALTIPFPQTEATVNLLFWRYHTTSVLTICGGNGHLESPIVGGRAGSGRAPSAGIVREADSCTIDFRAAQRTSRHKRGISNSPGFARGARRRASRCHRP
jgi:hypothetical protein